MGALAQLFASLFGVLGIHVPMWALAAAVAGGVALFWPQVRRNDRLDTARKRLEKRASVAGQDDSDDAIFALVADNPDGLVVVADEALAWKRVALARRAVASLKASGRRAADVRRLERALDGNLPTTIDEMVLSLERLQAQGLEEMLAQRLKIAEARWPGDPAWAAFRPKEQA